MINEPASLHQHKGYRSYTYNLIKHEIRTTEKPLSTQLVSIATVSVLTTMSRILVASEVTLFWKLKGK